MLNWCIMENFCKFCGRTTKYGCTLCDNKVCVICAADERKVDESGYNGENHQVGKCPRGACNNNNNKNNDSKADADDIDVKTAVARSSKMRVGNIVSGKRVNIFNYFGTAQKGKLCVVQKMKMDTLISDINDINSSKENETSNISFKEKKIEGKCSSKTCGPVPLDTKKVISKSIKRVFNDENFGNVGNKKPKIGYRNHVVDSTIKITSQAADKVLISNTKMKNEIYGLFKKVFNDLAQ